MEFLGPVTRLGGRLVRPHDLELFTDPGRRRGAGARSPGCSESASKCGPNCGPATEQPWAQLTRGQAEALELAEGSRVWVRARRAERVCEDAGVQISAKTDYAVRALLSLAAREPDLVKVDVIVREQRLPRKFVEAILGELRRASIWSAASAAPKAGTRWPGRRVRSRSVR